MKFKESSTSNLHEDLLEFLEVFLLSMLGSLLCSLILNIVVIFRYILFEGRNIHLGGHSWIVRKKVQTHFIGYPTAWRLDLIITRTCIRNLILEPYKACCSRYCLSKATALGRSCTETWLKVETHSGKNVLHYNLYSLIIWHGKKKIYFKVKLHIFWSNTHTFFNFLGDIIQQLFL